MYEDVENLLENNILAMVEELPLDERVKMLIAAHKAVCDFKDAWYIHKFKRFMSEVNNFELEKAVKLSEKLFGNEKKKENALRIISTLDKIDTEKKVDYLANAVIAFLLGQINEKTLFRFANVLVEVLSEDLEFLKHHITCDEIKWSVESQALEKAGLLIQYKNTYHANSTLAEQTYTISELGYAFDKYVLSRLDEERQRW